MKLLHISDLHIGKKVNEISMLEEQKHVLNQVLEQIKEHKPDYLIIAGDVYDKPIPSVEAIELFDEFLFQIAKSEQKTIIISGNHDSGERLGFANRLFKFNHILLSTSFDAATMLHTDEDEYGKVDFYMIPFIKPITVRRHFEEANWSDYTDMFEAALKYLDENRTKVHEEHGQKVNELAHLREENKTTMSTDGNPRRKVLIAHQFITGATRSDSEEVNVGGLDNISSEILTGFDYAALGHIHGPQQIQSERIRYSGSICKYSFSEEKHNKCALLVELGKPIEQNLCEISIKELPLKGKRDFCTLRGTYSELTLKENYKDTNTDDYIRIILTDEEDQPDAFYKLRVIYPNLMSLEYDNARTKGSNPIAPETFVKRSPVESFAELFEIQNNREMSEEQKTYINHIFEEVFEER